MGGLLSRQGTEAYYANYEKSFERLEKESAKILDRRMKRRRSMDSCSNIGFWITATGFCVAILLTAYLQQVGTQKWYQKSLTILAAFAVPLVSALVFKAFLWVLRLVEARDERFLRKLMDAKRKMVKELKDSTRFDRIASLIKKYDPDEQQAVVQPHIVDPPASGGLRRRQSAPIPTGHTPNGATVPVPVPGGSLSRQAAAAAASAAVSVAAGTGKALMPVFESLANNLVGDNPVLLQEAQQLRDENAKLQAKLAEIEARLAQTAGATSDEGEGKVAQEVDVD
ncbi:hypothetical protein GPECTOR_1g385 [Gonium pectorale]|uniref:Uncharacterized protein n=1 Tax=Gonium pectorale TaxID=33097 RepID=A0A150H365_GONPE|nr:hypothetical protein GPECTOR_1g385 [Gonium pectorale]|eukprot:KXZ56432.1 hypothetical protein GPECTOR_1g385 [Gonium pectorale]